MLRILYYSLLGTKYFVLLFRPVFMSMQACRATRRLQLASRSVRDTAKANCGGYVRELLAAEALYLSNAFPICIPYFANMSDIVYTAPGIETLRFKRYAFFCIYAVCGLTCLAVCSLLSRVAFLFLGHPVAPCLR